MFIGFSSETMYNELDRSFFSLLLFYYRFVIFRRCVDAKMKDGTRQCS